MGLFSKKKELTDEEFDQEMKALEQQITRLQKQNKLMQTKAALKAEIKQNSGWAQTGAKIFKGLGEAGVNVKANLDKESQSGMGINFNNDSLTKDLPGVSKGSAFNSDSITGGLPGVVSKPLKVHR